MTDVTIPFPNWCWVVVSAGLLTLVFYTGGVHCRATEICVEFPKIRLTLVRISEILLQKGLSDDFVFTQSPVRLTPEGEKAVQHAGFPEFYDTNKSLILHAIKKQNPKLIEKYAYSSGIPIAKILFAGAVSLRDLLSKEMGITD